MQVRIHLMQVGSGEIDHQHNDAAGVACKIDFASREYWDHRFEEEDEFDWLGDFNAVSGSLLKHMARRPVHTDDDDGIDDGEDDEGTKISALSCKLEFPYDARIAVVGCGNSMFSYQLFQAGFTDITNTDFSETVINKMKRRYPMMKWVVDDMTNSMLMPDSFDFILEKGAMDCLTQDEGDPWNPNEETRMQTKRMMESVMRCLKPGGIGKFIQISFQQPHFRLKYLQQVPLRESCVAVERVQFGLGYFLYVCTKP